MGQALEIIAGNVLDAGTSFETVTMAPGNSASLRAAVPGSAVTLVAAWAHLQTLGAVRIRSPLMHDNVNGFRAGVILAQPLPLWPLGIVQPLQPHDDLILEILATDVDLDIETLCLLIHYSDLPGASANLISGDELRGRVEHVLTVTNTINPLLVGGWSGSQVFNTTNDLLRSGRQYALLGSYSTLITGAVRWTSSDWANLGVGVPGAITDPQLTANWFPRISDATGIPMIPVIDADNVGSITIDIAHNELDVDPVVTTVLALLSQ